MRKYLKDLKDLNQAADRLKSGQEYVATERATGIADGSTALDVVFMNPAESGEDAYLVSEFATGGEAHLDVGEDATINTAGTALNVQNKGAANSQESVIEAGGTYSSSNPLETVLPGSSRAGGPSTRTGTTSIAVVRLIEPGDGLQFTLTNRSGVAADFSGTFNWVEVDLE